MKHLFARINAQTYALVVLAVLVVVVLDYLFAHHREGFFTLASAFVGATVAFILNTAWSISWSAAEQKKKDVTSVNNLGVMLDELYRTQCAFYEHYDPKRERPDRTYTIGLLIVDNLDRQESISEDIKFLVRLDEPKIVKNIQIVVRHYNNLIKILIKRERYINILQDRIRKKYTDGAVDFKFIDRKGDPDWQAAEGLTDNMIEFCDQNILDIEGVMTQLSETMRQKFPKAHIYDFRRVERNNNQPTNTSK